MGYYSVYNGEFLMHHGVKGMHWGIRRYQNPDGTLTTAGRERYSKKLLKRAMKLNEAYSRYARGVQDDIRRGNLLVKPTGGKKNEVFLQSKTVGKNQQLISKREYETDMVAYKIQKKYGTVEYQKIKVMVDNDPAYKQAKQLVNKILSENTKVMAWAQSQKIPNSSKASSAKKREQVIQKFISSNKPVKNAPNSVKDIDDPELLDLHIDDPSFRKEYGISDSEYSRYKKEVC